MTASFPSRDSDFPVDLRLYSARIEARQSSATWRNSARRYRLLYKEEYYGAHLMPLTRRDWKALNQIFGSVTDLEGIYEDIQNALSILIPEPCWEDDPFTPEEEENLGFLAEFLS
ncbi:hypothetical protein K4A83_03820 [Spirulina subsalsa FACHB-351]|uniref:Uncharacterized protein n=1 Tax=Spirulina subsalsa FACHB-351 TaxID=234711 RepID=A0ABT3L1N0_9CYAN|nr:hypothetical protein [Spirulina subsalsa]MCW6035404.1 hypothetical protein [Spirulina subsalsa FACHB-351]